MIEAIMVMLTIGVIATLLLGTVGRIYEVSKIKLTKEREAIIEMAINGYIKRNKDLPCPARVNKIPKNPNFGVEADFINGGCFDPANDPADPSDDPPGLYIAPGRDVGNDHDGDGATDPEHVVIGNVPVRTLGLSDEFALDGWGNRFTYAVSANQTQGALKSAKGVIEVNDTSLPPRSVLRNPGTALYVLASHGKDGRGAIRLDSKPTDTACGAGGVIFDDENCDNGNGTFKAGFYSTKKVQSGLGHFDDIVSYVAFLQEPAVNPCDERLAFFSPGNSAADADGCVSNPLVVIRWSREELPCDPFMGSNENPASSVPTANKSPIADSSGVAYDCATINFSPVSAAKGTFSVANGVELYHNASYVSNVDGKLRIVATIPTYYRNINFNAAPAWESAWMATVFVDGVRVMVGDLINPGQSVYPGGGAVATVVAETPVTAGQTYDIMIRLVAVGASTSNGSTANTGWAGTIRFGDYFVTGTVEFLEIAL